MGVHPRLLTRSPELGPQYGGQRHPIAAGITKLLQLNDPDVVGVFAQLGYVDEPRLSSVLAANYASTLQVGWEAFQGPSAPKQPSLEPIACLFVWLAAQNTAGWRADSVHTCGTHHTLTSWLPPVVVALKPWFRCWLSRAMTPSRACAPSLSRPRCPYPPCWQTHSSRWGATVTKQGGKRAGRQSQKQPEKLCGAKQQPPASSQQVAPSLLLFPCLVVCPENACSWLLLSLSPPVSYVCVLLSLAPPGVPA